MRGIEVGMEQRRNERVGEMGDPRENPTTTNIVWHESHMVIEVSMEQRLNERLGESGDPQENPLTSGVVWLESHMRKSGSDPAEN
ncbi:hypothetical protein PR048_018076 [Dryococelus australis]|uniref:Uncharacterized protein n=1 Tax=Dryococelus australis TaxID=614101 RepID=A0ABQ9HBE6_9NEOP|nr:hypothetical protein PR048_018076 [Dryococelus australis]